ncbi:helix-turn-helix transcriptional regulator [Thiothrix litoralis]|jgi:transcriptional regulator with XRE-family HTH domain|uniref:Helix-turn-helix transcriptional regulator n=1 Tax=Thiothrix litoralis TaxID=2891210 RepID=A0ABX7WUP0_9GAMM|nr:MULTISPECIES: helix-turn-helix transcriptional regulator [Thiothrix]QTR45953.1 helix-turn-helix transcriptional regulator [Thiothrix litoralis]WMP19078.1 helix-turn-helix transcriptional regulator [Thiothrix lacustris]
MAKLLSLSTRTQTVLQVFAGMIRAARLERKMPQQDLAERLGVSRQTISAIEKGDAKVAIGTVFEAAAIVGIPLLAESSRDLQRLSTTVAGLTSLLPERARVPQVELDDDF